MSLSAMETKQRKQTQRPHSHNRQLRTLQPPPRIMMVTCRCLLKVACRIVHCVYCVVETVEARDKARSDFRKRVCRLAKLVVAEWLPLDCAADQMAKKQLLEVLLVQDINLRTVVHVAVLSACLLGYVGSIATWIFRLAASSQRPRDSKSCTHTGKDRHVQVFRRPGQYIRD